MPSLLNSLSVYQGHEVRCYDDVMAYIAERQDEAHRRNIVEDKMKRSTVAALIMRLDENEQSEV